MAREVDFDNLNDGDIEYLRGRHWLVEEAELQGYEGLRETVDNWQDGQTAEAEGDSNENPQGEPDEITYEDATIADLKAELEARELPTSGNKRELITRLEEDDTKRASEEEEEEEEG